MQVSKFLLTVCTTAVCAGFISVHAQDNPAQAAARAALMEQFKAADAAQNPPPPAVNTPVPPAAPAAPEPATTVPADIQPATTVPAASNSTPEDTEAQAKARAALLEQMQLQNPAPAAAPAAPVVPTPVVPAAMPKTNAVAAKAPAKPVQPKPAAPAVTKTAGNGPGFAPITAPPLPISMTKEEQLRDLNAKYMANEISPQDYFKQREAIINGQ